MIRFLALAGFAAAIAGSIAQAAAGETLTQVRARGALRCGVSEGIAGFSIQDERGKWSGLDVDFCRAVAAMALGDAGKVTFVRLKASARFPALRAAQVDLLARNTTWTLEREAGLKLQFAGVLYYDGQAFMVPAKNGIKKLAQLKGATVCVEKGTTSAQNLAVNTADLNPSLKPAVFDSAIEVADAFFSGKCQALSSDASQLAAMRLRAPAGASSFVILPERVSKEPLGPVVRNGDDDWLTLVRWTLFGLIGLEEAGVTIANSNRRSDDPAVRRILGADDQSAKMLGIERGWQLRLLQSAGNYGEMYDRNVGAGSPLKLDRGLNRLWTQGGLMYSPPLH